MAIGCIACNSPERKNIDRAIRRELKKDSGKKRSWKPISDKYGIDIQAIRRHALNHVAAPTEPVPLDAPIELLDRVKKPRKRAIAEDSSQAEDLPEPVGQPRRLNAYEEVLALKAKTETLLAAAEEREDTGMQVVMIREARQNIEAMVKIYETQKRIEAAYAPPDRVEASEVYSYLKRNYPSVLLNLVRYLKETHEGGESRTP